MTLPKDLPPLLALRAFESVARHLSFIKAADELSVSQSAVSHQIQKLEQHLDQRLFIRRTRAIDLSDAGSRYYQQIRPALEQIAEASRQLRTPTSPRVLRIGLLASFATLWLAPRLTDFMTRHPQIQVALEPSIQLADVAGAQVDLAIRYGKGGWPDVEARRLMGERLFPVCSPAYKASASGPGPLLMAQARHPFEWIDWARHHHIDLQPYPTAMLHDYNIVVEAAVAGQGIAMGRQRLIERRLRDGSLVPAFDTPPYESEIGYWLIRPNTLPCAEAECFCTWLTEQCANA
ncbi:LysR substrate-binding domain-containing protein [Pseudomonas vanderleydeniana]|uniref:LysR family transcriptional regulator n=1 Tax=Pseudomonas vanderleydeniana TaxID=2745495 RepID=A0A9E6TTI0_9PSED|nr:LysR substrate-binding domain-containing protein [Pseudomonas vanderleydeniana]QXI29817.1 LysR family transcriptional regulator [Pseudomonas vanderleydeniana]